MHRSFCWFCQAAAQISLKKIFNSLLSRAANKVHCNNHLGTHHMYIWSYFTQHLVAQIFSYKSLMALSAFQHLVQFERDVYTVIGATDFVSRL